MSDDFEDDDFAPIEGCVFCGNAWDETCEFCGSRVCQSHVEECCDEQEVG